jgi:hypothetical protein
MRLEKADRWLWMSLSRVWTEWRSALVIVKPETVIAWHRRGFQMFWTWKSRRRTGRPTVPADVRMLIRTRSQANLRWGAPRIHGAEAQAGATLPSQPANAQSTVNAAGFALLRPITDADAQSRIRDFILEQFARYERELAQSA